jgi:signal transduction histidine kinase
MSGWVWVALVAATAMLAFALDQYVWPDHTMLVVYALPILVASLRFGPRAVIGVTTIVLLLAIADLYLAHRATERDAIRIAILVVAGGLAVVHSIQHEAHREKIQRQQTVICMVEQLRQPLAVIQGYAQLLASRQPDETTIERACAAIGRASRSLRDQLDAILDKADEL